MCLLWLYNSSGKIVLTFKINYEEWEDMHQRRGGWEERETEGGRGKGREMGQGEKILNVLQEG